MVYWLLYVWLGGAAVMAINRSRLPVVAGKLFTHKNVPID